MYKHSQRFLKLTHHTRLFGTRPTSILIPYGRTYISTTDYTEGTHHVGPSNQLDELLSHLESTKVSDPRTVSKMYQVKIV